MRSNRFGSLRNLLIGLVTLSILATIAIFSQRRAHRRALASCVLSNNLRQTDAAKDQYALETRKKRGDPEPRWVDLTPYLKASRKLVSDGGKDQLGNPILIGKIGEDLHVNPQTKQMLKGVVDDAFGGPTAEHGS